MLITILKTYNGQVAVKAEQKVGSLEDLVMFATKLGVNQNFEEYVQDFMEAADRTYIVGLENGLQ